VRLGGSRLQLGDQGGDRDGATKRDGARRRPGGRRRDERRSNGRRPSAFGSHGHPGRLETHDDGAVTIRSKDPGAGRREAVEGRLRRVAIRVAGPGGRHRDPGPDGIDEGLRGGGLAPMMGDLEQVDMWQAIGQEVRIDRLLDVAHQQEPPRSDLSEQHDGDVVDARAAVGRLDRDLAPDRPEHAQGDLVDLEAIPRGDDATDRRCGV
jgi:hypothetical protein